MNEHEKLFDENGVILIKNAWEVEAIGSVKKEYEILDKSLVRKEIIKDEPIIVFWKHVVGEQKKFAPLENFQLYGILLKMC